MTRPSTRCAVIVSSVTTMCPMRLSTLTAVLMPSPNDRGFVPSNQMANLVEFTRAEALIPCQRDRRQPELALLSISPNMDVYWFVAVETVEEEPIRPWNADNLWHSIRLYA